MRIFVSYRHADEQWFAQGIRDEIQKTVPEARVFFDSNEVQRPGAGLDRILSWIPFVDLLVIPIHDAQKWLGEDGTNGYRISENTDWIRQELEAALKLGKPLLFVFRDHDQQEQVKEFAKSHNETTIGRVIEDAQRNVQQIVVDNAPGKLVELVEIRAQLPLQCSTQAIVTRDGSGLLWTHAGPDAVETLRPCEPDEMKDEDRQPIAVSPDGWFACRFRQNVLALFVLDDPRLGTYGQLASVAIDGVRIPAALAIRRSGQSSIEVAFSGRVDNGRGGEEVAFFRSELEIDAHQDAIITGRTSVHANAVLCACFVGDELRFVAVDNEHVMIHKHGSPEIGTEAQNGQPADWVDAAVWDGIWVYGELRIGDEGAGAAGFVLVVNGATRAQGPGNGQRRFSIPRVLSRPDPDNHIQSVVTGSTLRWAGQG